MKRLVINADDFGMTLGVNKAILKLQAAGIVTSVSQLAGGGGMPLPGSGVHLRLTDGVPALSPRLIPSLVTNGLFPRQRHQIGAVDPKEVKAEFEAQIRDHELPPSHLDTHSHSHSIPEVFEVYAELCQRYHCPGVPLTARQRTILRQMGVRTADYAEIRWVGNRALPPILQGDFERYETVHLMCHPGYADDELRARSTMCEAREREMEYLLSQEFRQFLNAENIQLIGMADLPAVDPLAQVDIIYLASNRREFTVQSLRALRRNTDWARVRKVFVYHDGYSEDGTRQALRAEMGDWPKASLLTTDFGSPVAVMNDYLSRSPSAWFAKVDNDTMLPAGWLTQCLEVLERHPFIDLLGIEAIHPIGDGTRVAEPCSHIGGIGLMRTSAFTELPEPNGRSGFGDWQNAHLEVTRAWLKPGIAVFLLDRLPFEPWKSLSVRYEERGWQRPWRRYTDADKELWQWWKQNG